MKASKVFLLAFLIMMSLCLVNTQPVKSQSSGTIYIRADGSVDPVGAPIQRDGNVYTFTADIFDSIVVEKDDVVIDGADFILQGNGSGYGIHLIHRSYVTIRNMEIKEFDTGLRLYGGSNNTIYGNDIASNEWGIYLIDYSENNTISGNNLTNNDHGIFLLASRTNVLRNNSMNNNTYNLGIVGESVNDIDTSNTVDGKPIYYWVNKRDRTVPLDAGYVALVNCTGITVKNLNLANNEYGILLAFTKNSTITQNTVTNNGAGIELYGSSRNNSLSGNHIANNEGNGIRLYGCPENSITGNNITNNAHYGTLLWFSNYNNISGNNITANELGTYLYGSLNNNVFENNIANNKGFGIWFFGSSHNNISGNNITDNHGSMYFEMQSFNNTIYHNNFVNNTLQVSTTTEDVNVWDNGVEGNYWSDYEDRYPDATELDGSGIWSTPYVINENNQDNYPLINQWIPPTQQSELFPTTWIVAAIAIIAVAGAALLVYFGKIKKTTRKAEK